VSQQLAKLERETGATLVEKDGRRLRLTEAGRVLADHAERVLASVDEAEAALAAHGDTVIGRLEVAAFATACRALLPYALHRLATEHPQLTTGLVEISPHEGLDMLRRGHVDLAVLDDWPEVALRYPPGVTHLELGRDVVDLVVPDGHRFAAGREVRLAQARDERWIAAKSGDICHEWLMRVMPGVRPDFHVGEFETQLTLIAAGLGIAVIPRPSWLPFANRVVRLMSRLGLPLGTVRVLIVPGRRSGEPRPTGLPVDRRRPALCGLGAATERLGPQHPGRRPR
jgi:DNA-binding transcriptional LysR family regulator